MNNQATAEAQRSGGMPASESLLEARDIHKSYTMGRRTLEVLRGLDLLTRVGLGDRLEHKPYELSGGEQQRVALARALINSPEIILADEPTGNLDSRTGEEIIELLCALRAEREATLIIATHDTKVAARAPRVLELADGRIVE